jgi:hypothetical protein
VVQGGTTNNDFTLDINHNAEQFISLIYGNSGKSLIFDLLSNWFNLNGRLNINGFSGIKLAINAHGNDDETQQLSIRNSSGSAVFHVDEDGDLAVHAITLPAGTGDSPTAVSKHLSVIANNVVTNSIAPDGCGDYADITVTGAATGDSIIITPFPESGGIETVPLSWNAYVNATDNVKIRACNPGAVAVNTADTQTWRVDVWGH